MSQRDLQALHAGRAKNIHARAQWLYLLSAGVMEVDSFFSAVTSPGGQALKAITLRQLLVRGLGWSRTKTEKTLDRMDKLLGSETDRRRMTVGWLLDPNCGGRRFQVWTEIHEAKTHAPWLGFPFTRNPGKQ